MLKSKENVIVRYIYCYIHMDLNEFDAYYLNNLLDTLWKKNKTVFLRDILINKLRVNILTSCVYCTNCQLPFAEELWVTVYCTSYEFFLLQELRVTFCMRVTSYFLYASYELLFNWVTIKIKMIKLFMIIRLW